MYRDARGSSSKRFCKPHRMMLVQGDIKYGPKLPIGKNGAKVQTYLSSAMDDHSRLLLASRFYDNQEESIVEDTFHQAILRYGTFDACYFDNGSQYIAKQVKNSLAKLGIREYYESLGAAIPKAGITPLQEWNWDSRPLTYLDISVVSEAFLHHEIRKVDKGACISFRGRKYETKPTLIGYQVEIAYDPAAPEIITVSYPGYEPFSARPVKIGEFCDPNPTLPVVMQGQTLTTSRFLTHWNGNIRNQPAGWRTTH